MYLCSRYQLKAAMQERIKQQLPDNLLETISLADNRDAIRWEEKGSEFSWHDQLYDVVRTTHRNGKTYLVCLADQKEEALVQKVCDVAGNDQHPGGNSNLPPVFKLSDDFIITGLLRLAPCHTVTAPAYSFYTVSLLQRAMPIVVPPPRC